MTVEILLIVFVGVTAISFVVQAIVVRKTMATTRLLVEKVSKSSSDIENDIRQVVSKLQEITTGLEHVRRSFENVGDRATEINQMFELRAHDVDELMKKLVDVGSKQAERIDDVVADTVQKFEQTTDIIQEDILRPVVEISSLIKGLKTGLDYLFSRNRRASRQEEFVDDDMFI